jgi:hypothetical protein
MSYKLTTLVDGFIFPPNETELQIFIALKNPLSSYRFEPACLGSNLKHADGDLEKERERESGLKKSRKFFSLTRQRVQISTVQ